MRARGRAGVRWMRNGEANPLVVLLDHLVTGLAGGDQITAAVFDADEQVDESMRNRCN